MSLTAVDPRNAVESGLRSVSRQTRSGRAEPFTVCIVGVDGCGKSSVFGGSIERLAGRMRVVGIGDVVLSGAPSEPVRERRDIPASRLTSALGRFAKSLRWQGLYKNLKFLELSERTRLRDYVAHHDPPDLILTDGDPLINTAAWAVARFYRRQLADDDSLLEMLHYVVGEQRLSGAAVLRYLRTGWQLIPLNLLRLGRFTYPDLVVLLEIDPSAAMARIRARGRPLQVHETETFLSELSMAYARVCGLLQARVGVPVLRIRADQVSLENIVQTVDTAITERLESERQARGSRPVVAGGIEVVATTMSGSLQDQQKIELIEPEFRTRTDRPVTVTKAHSHAEARSIAHDLVARGARILVSAGGAGTFNAVLEGAHLDAGVPEDLRLAFLRKGSADLIGKSLGIPDQLPEAVQAIADGIEAHHDVAADILVVEATSPNGERQRRHLVGFGGFGVFGEVPRFTETRWVKLYKGVLGTLLGDLGPFFVGLPLAIASWQLQRFVGRIPPLVLVLDDDELPPDTWSAVLVLNGDLGREFPLGRDLSLSSRTFRVVALRYRGMRQAFEQLIACRRGTVLGNPEGFRAVVRTVKALEVRPLGTRPYLINVDGLRMHARGVARVSLSGQVNLIPAPAAARMSGTPSAA